MKELIIGFDTETTGIPVWKKPSDDAEQPHLVQIAAGLYEVESRKMIQSIDLIIKPEGWEIPKETSDVHGITTEYAQDVGIPEKVALDMFLSLWAGHQRVAFNTTFDNRIIRIATKRFCSEDTQTKWRESDYQCAMMKSRKIMGGKNPKLEDAHKHFTGNDLKDAHTALADMKACMDVYWACTDHLDAA